MCAKLDEYPSCTEAELSSLYFRKLPSVLTVEKVKASHNWYGNDSIRNINRCVYRWRLLITL